MTRRWSTASTAISCGLVYQAALLGAACSPSTGGAEPLAPTSLEAPSNELEPEAAPPDTAAASPSEATAPIGTPEGAPGAEPTEPAPAPAGAEPDDDTGSEQLVKFFEIGRGDRVADLGGVFGYSLTPTRRAMGPAGVLYVQRRTPPPADPAASGDNDLGKLVWMNTPNEAPFTAEATRLNAVTLLFAYHAVVAAGHDRRKLNGAVYRALVPGGVYIIADHAAPAGSGVAAARDENRIEDGLVRSEVQAAGFQFVEAADFVSNAISSADRTPGGQYLLKFRKPK